MNHLQYLNIALSEGWFNVWAWGFTIDFKQDDYDAALRNLSETMVAPSHDDVLTKIIEMGGSLHFKDCMGDMSQYLDEPGLKRGMAYVPSQVTKAIDKDDFDADTVNELLQYVLFKKIVFA